MNATENKLKHQNQVYSGMIESAFAFWFNDNAHIRSPFPEYIREKLQANATGKFLDWCTKISDKAKKEINDEILAEKFEEILFELALHLVLTEDERLTIRYPFMMRIGDKVNEKEATEKEASNEVIDRTFLKKGDSAFMKVKIKSTNSGKIWEREFELPE